MKTKKTGQTGRSELDNEWIYGINPVIEAIKAGRDIKGIYISSNRRDKISEIKREADHRKIPLKITESDFFDRNFRKGHQGIAAEVSSKDYVTLDELLEIPARRKEIPLFLILDCIEDPRNFGAILRVSDAAGIHGIIIQSHRSVTLSPEVSKASAGAVEYVPVSIMPNIKHAIYEMKKSGITIIGAEASAEKSLFSIDLKVPVGLVIGSEGKGIRKSVRENCDVLVRLPMYGNINSLNVSVATGIFAFEIIRQRLHKN
ncbi:MAG: 23S rRNA (guanosine(2251)-2'-O)-methyltransferase RlmB [Nitrospirota bacterium]